jgi:hypothetical protein
MSNSNCPGVTSGTQNEKAIGQRDHPTKLPSLPTEKWLEHIRKLEDALRNTAEARDGYRTLYYGTWTLIGIVLTVVGYALTGRRHAGFGAYSIVAIGIGVAWCSIYRFARRK